MYFESIEEQERIERIASRIEFVSEEQGNSDYRHCIVKASPEFEEILSGEEWDVIALTALELYENSLEENCKKVRHYKYMLCRENIVVHYKVTKTDNIAYFEIDKIVLGAKL